MSVYIGKILWWLVSPANLPLALLFGGVALACWRRTRLLGIRLAAAMTVFFLLIGILPVANWVLRPLEEHVPQQPLPSQVDGIVVLGGSEQVVIAESRNRPELSNAADRLIAFVALARKYPQARLIYTGGGIHWGETTLNEADIAARVFEDLGLDPGRVTFDSRSRSTAENAAFGKALADPQPGETWIMITSAAHMPRALNAFNAVSWPVLPYPVDYRTATPRGFGLRFRPLGNLLTLEGAVHEWVGLVAYWALGHTTSILPPLPATTDAANVTAEAWPLRRH
ncbi:MAG TPA: YdcF family protein [Ferrovibrio sp.]|jgi:uncharacterized SAM-binding protein YcdF (DUF218 family)|uniref:YdcF family protein n=1 Tax=Ferrovibrio sp. TaxID=1917215 RepID=UPI002B4B2E85|nr:YdcF family protein [Ferrovibrio sp.]HLT77364.1 YdcF family protein [Ferrovibrio sp.]